MRVILAACAMRTKGAKPPNLIHRNARGLTGAISPESRLTPNDRGPVRVNRAPGVARTGVTSGPTGYLPSSVVALGVSSGFGVPFCFAFFSRWFMATGSDGRNRREMPTDHAMSVSLSLSP